MQMLNIYIYFKIYVLNNIVRIASGYIFYYMKYITSYILYTGLSVEI